jgi:uncharacterized protein YdeI (YjbR/CyaY-like superfamily)
MQPNDTYLQYIPDDFQSALALNETASANFANLPEENKRLLVDLIDAAGVVGARMESIDDIVLRLAEGLVET